MLNLLWVIAAVLVMMWMIGFALHAFGGFVHLFLVLAAVALVVRLLIGPRTS